MKTIEYINERFGLNIKHGSKIKLVKADWHDNELDLSIDGKTIVLVPVLEMELIDCGILKRVPMEGTIYTKLEVA